MSKSCFISSIIGHAVGDAMGVPVEFSIREKLLEHPVTDMMGYGSHPVPAGYWSDDTSMEIATIDSFIEKNGWDYDDILNKYAEWVQNGKYTPGGEVFDIGRTCLRAIRKYQQSKVEKTGIKPIDAGQKDLMGNGNGALMRILPVALYCVDSNMSDNEIIELVSNVSSLTHGHEIGILACYIYVKYILFLIDGCTKEEAYKKIKELDYSYFTNDSLSVYDRLLKDDIMTLKLSDIKSTAYVVDTLEASFYVLLNCYNYRQSIIGAINLGNDTDTIAAIVGSMAGIIYGYNDIPEKWIDGLAKKDYLLDLASKFELAVKRSHIYED